MPPRGSLRTDAQIHGYCATVAGNRGRDILDACLPLIGYEAQPGLGPAIRKYLPARRGIIASGAPVRR